MTALERVLERIEKEIRPKLDIRPRYDPDTDEEVGGYNCCGCSTYEKIVDDIVRIIHTEKNR